MCPLCEHLLRNITKTLKLQKLVVNHQIKNLMRRMPVIFVPAIDEKVGTFMVSLYKKGGHASRSIAATTAMVRTDDENAVVISTWGRSLLQRIGFQRRVPTTGKVEILENAKKEAGLQHHYRITSIVEEHNIPKSLVINNDQISSKYDQVGRFTMARRGAKKLGVAGIADKRMITLTLTVSMD